MFHLFLLPLLQLGLAVHQTQLGARANGQMAQTLLPATADRVRVTTDFLLEVLPLVGILILQEEPGKCEQADPVAVLF
jgi:hypothetical protein